MGRWVFAVSHFLRHFSTITDFWEHRAQADFITANGNLIQVAGISGQIGRCDMTRGESIQISIDWKSTSYPGREKAFYKKYLGKILTYLKIMGMES